MRCGDQLSLANNSEGLSILENLRMVLFRNRNVEEMFGFFYFFFSGQKTGEQL